MSPARRPAARVPLPVSREEQTAIVLARVVWAQAHRVEGLLKPHGLTPTQYNVLRILNGAPDGLCGTDIGARLVAQVPDVTRLLDRLAEAGLIERERDMHNRRYVTARLTDAGRAKLLETTPLLVEFHREQFHALSRDQIATLRALVGLIGQGAAGPV